MCSVPRLSATRNNAERILEEGGQTGLRFFARISAPRRVSSAGKCRSLLRTPFARPPANNSASLGQFKIAGEIRKTRHRLDGESSALSRRGECQLGGIVWREETRIAPV